MNFQAALSSINQPLKNYCYDSQQAALSIVLKLKDFRNNPEFFQKVCQVAFASLQLIITRYPEAANLSRFSFVLMTANMHDFYKFLKQPRQLFYPVNAESIDENALLDSLTAVLFNQLYKKDGDSSSDDEVLKVDSPVDSSDIRSGLRGVLRDCLKAQLEQMADNNDSYRNIEQFKQVFQKRLQKLENDGFNFPNIELDDVEVLLRPTPLAETLTNLIWTLLDIVCVGLYSRGWKLLDTAKWAEQMGQHKGFQWIKNQHLDTWVVGLVCAGFTLKFLEAIRKLRVEALTEEGRNQARWNAITSLVELIFYGAIYLNQIGQTKIDHSYVHCLGILAKSLGLLSIAMRPKHQFFQQAEAATAA